MDLRLSDFAEALKTTTAAVRNRIQQGTLPWLDRNIVGVGNGTVASRRHLARPMGCAAFTVLPMLSPGFLPIA